MYYIQRDSQGFLVRVADVPFDEMTGKLAKDSPEVIRWRKNQEVMLNGL